MVEYTYDSWGKLLRTTGSLSETFGKEQPFRYRGYVYDEETGWYYLQSRYYNPEIGRFVSADVYLSTGQGVLGHNAYAYCLNNPINRSDSSGAIPVTDILDFFREMIEGGGGGAAGGQSNGGGVPAPTGDSGVSNGASSASVNSGGGIVVGFIEEEKHPGGKNGLAKGSNSHPDVPSGNYLDSTDIYLYRSVSNAEANDFSSTGKLSAGAGQMEGKFFATSIADAKIWGQS